MNLKTSFCKSVIKSDFKRFWWVSALYTLCMFLFYTFIELRAHYYDYYNYYDAIMRTEYEYSRIFSYSPGLWILALTVPVVLAALLFSYMQSGASSTFAHSIPVTRGQTFFAHLISGVVMIIIPHIINGAVLMFYRFDAAFAETFEIAWLFNVMYTSLIYALVAFSIATFMSFVAGNMIASVIFSYVLGFLPVALESFIIGFLNIQLFGYDNSYRDLFVQNLYIAPEEFVQIKYVLFYLLLAVIFFALAYFVYRIRNLENHSEVVAFPKLKPIFIYGVGISFGCVGYLYFNEIFNYESALFLIPFGIVGIIIAKMVSLKTFRVNGVFKDIVIYSAFIGVLFLVFNYDLTGFEKRVPETDRIESIEYDLSINYEAEAGADFEGKVYYYDNIYRPLLKDKADIEKAAALHKIIIENADAIKEQSNDSNYSDMPLKLTYNFDNGKTLVRSYNINYKDFKEYLNPIAETDVIRKDYFPVLRDRNIKLDFVSIADNRINNGDAYIMYYDGNPDMQKRILDALKKDLISASADEYADRKETFTSVVLNFKKAAHYENGIEVDASKMRATTERYYIRSSYENTKALIEETGLYDAVFKASDIDKIGVVVYNEDRMVEVKIGDNSDMYTKVIEAPEKIEKIYNYLQENGYSIRHMEGYITLFLKNKERYTVDLDSTDKEFCELLGI